ncbi:hypothetical protein [Bizionia arctica]|uniref:Uncharacterized protein n=1 Tax=Bizionia arctica TaxID=1495645 RepID=A0A917LQU2_9FLAO|nr:hypothetical protein [Bizionia arctica]GGG52532.1 hypothetical protein GCM10010976_24550 [Bizionia arctica]
MIKLSNINTYTETPIQIIEPEEILEHDVERDFGKSMFFDNTLITRHTNRFKIWDVTDITTIKLISTTPLSWGGGQFEKEGNLLYLAFGEGFGLDQILVYDISDLNNPFKVKVIEVPEFIKFIIESGIIYLISSTEKAVLKVAENHETTKIIDLSNENQTMFFDTETNISKSGKNIFITSRHEGFYVYSELENNKYEFISKDKPANGYLPNDMQWLVADQEMLLIGNDNVVQYNVTNLNKLKRYKAAKIKTKEIYGAYAKRNQELLVVGNTGANDKFVVAVLAQQEEGGITLSQKPKVECKIKKPSNGKIVKGDPVVGFLLKDDFLLIIGRNNGFFLFKATE